MSKTKESKDNGWFKMPGFFGSIIILVIVLNWFGDPSTESTNNHTLDKEVESTKEVKSYTQEDKWWESTNKYQICYANITKAHKENGLHDRDRIKSIQIKEEMCKIAATSKTGEGSFWLK